MATTIGNELRKTVGTGVRVLLFAAILLAILLMARAVAGWIDDESSAYEAAQTKTGDRFVVVYVPRAREIKIFTNGLAGRLLDPNDVEVWARVYLPDGPRELDATWSGDHFTLAPLLESAPAIEILVIDKNTRDIETFEFATAPGEEAS